MNIVILRRFQFLGETKLTDQQKIFVFCSNRIIHDFYGKDHRCYCNINITFPWTQELSDVPLNNKATVELCRLLINRYCGIYKLLRCEIIVKQKGNRRVTLRCGILHPGIVLLRHTIECNEDHTFCYGSQLCARYKMSLLLPFSVIVLILEIFIYISEYCCVSVRFIKHNLKISILRNIEQFLTVFRTQFVLTFIVCVHNEISSPICNQWNYLWLHVFVLLFYDYCNRMKNKTRDYVLRHTTTSYLYGAILSNYNQTQSAKYGIMIMYLTSNSLPHNSHLCVVTLLFLDRQLYSSCLFLKRRNIVNVRRSSLRISFIFRKWPMKQWFSWDFQLRFNARRLHNNLIETVAGQDHAFNCS